ncbi:MAG TPA: hypothetical protein V6C90_12435 [Coleofasciculaceae cyanobacterium]
MIVASVKSDGSKRGRKSWGAVKTLRTLKIKELSLLGIFLTVARDPI